MKHRSLSLALTLVLVSSASAQDWQRVALQLRDDSSSRKIAALKQLNDAGYADAADDAAPLVTDGDDAVQFAAIDAELTFFLAEPVAERGGRSRAQEAFDAGVLARTARPASSLLVDRLITATADNNARIRFDALHALGFIAEAPIDADRAKRIAAGLQSRDAVFRAATARVLGRVRAAAAGDALIDALNDSSELVQQFASESLGLVHHDRAVQALTDRVNYYNKGPLAASALSALARIAHPSSRDLLRGRLSDSDIAMRRAAVEGIGRLRDRASADRIRSMAGSDGAAEVRLAGLFALDRLGEPQLAGLCTSVGQSGISAQARDYLLETGPAAAPAVSAAISTSKDAAARAELVHLLGVVGGAADLPLLRSISKDSDARVSRAAAHAVAKLSR